MKPQMLPNIAPIELLKMKGVEIGLGHCDQLVGSQIFPLDEPDFEVSFCLGRQQFESVYCGESCEIEKSFSALWDAGDMDRKRCDEGGENSGFESIETKLTGRFKPEINEAFDSRVRCQFDG